MASKETQLARAKRRALLALLVAAIVFLLTLAAPDDLWWVRCIRMVSEAAMVGGLADWFAVAALFRRIPRHFTVPGVTAHTAVIPRGKDRIAQSLSSFVKEKYLEPDSIADLIRRNDPGQRMAHWLQDDANCQRLAGFVLRLVGGGLRWLEAERFQQLLRQAAGAALARADLCGAAATVLEALTRDGHHQKLLDQGLERLLRMLREPAVREFIAHAIVRWLREGQAWKRLLLPAEWIGEHGAPLIADKLSALVEEIQQDQGHRLREAFDQQVQTWIERLRTDVALRARGEQAKQWLLSDETMGDAIQGLWRQLASWARDDLRREDSAMGRHLQAGASWLGRQLASDAHLRETVNRQLAHGARDIARDFADVLTAHIRDTTQRWDAEDLSRQLELNIGKELQAIRLNGTAMGGAIGLLLFLVAQLAQWIRL